MRACVMTCMNQSICSRGGWRVRELHGRAVRVRKQQLYYYCLHQLAARLLPIDGARQPGGHPLPCGARLQASKYSPNNASKHGSTCARACSRVCHYFT